MNIMMTGVVEIVPFSPTNVPSARANSQALESDAVRRSGHSYNFILDEIIIVCFGQFSSEI